MPTLKETGRPQTSRDLRRPLSRWKHRRTGGSNPTGACESSSGIRFSRVWQWCQPHTALQRICTIESASCKHEFELQTVGIVCRLEPLVTARSFFAVIPAVGALIYMRIKAPRITAPTAGKPAPGGPSARRAASSITASTARFPLPPQMEGQQWIRALRQERQAQIQGGVVNTT